MASGFGAGAGADMLQQILRQKFTEALAQQRLAEDARQANMQNEVQRSGLDLGNRKLGEDVRQFDAQAGLREATTGHLGAETADLQARPAQAEAARAAAAANADAQRQFAGSQNDLNRQNATRIANINGARTIEAAKIRAAATGAGAQGTQPQANEIADTLALIDQIKADPSLPNATGPLDSRGLGMVTDTTGVTRVNALHNQLVGKMSLAQAGKLKGQGQISDKERQLLREAATALNQHMGDADYLNELEKVRSQFERMQTSGGATAPVVGSPAAGAGPQEFDYVPGKGLVPRVKK